MFIRQKNIEMDKYEKNFIQAYDIYADSIFRYCYFRVFSREQAEDLTQDVFKKTWEYVAEGKEVKNFRPFLYRVASNLIIDYSRKKKEVSLDKMQETGFQPSCEEKDKNIIFDSKETVKMIQKLDEKYREAVTMRYVEELSPKEIADILGETENVVSVRIHRGLEQLRKLAIK